MSKIDEAFGRNRDLPANYIAREAVDPSFRESLSRDKHVVIHGSSKTGKTSLRRQCMRDIDELNIHCLSSWALANLSEAILKSAGYETKRSDSQTVSGGWKIFASAKTSIFGSGAEGGAEANRDKSNTTVSEPIELDPTDVNDLISALRGARAPKIITLEDFHYLSTDVQREFSVFLKAIHENSDYVFVIIGVWLDENRLTQFNGDLAGRITSINADKWTREDLSKLVLRSEEILNIKFDNEFVDELLEFCTGSVYVVQEVMYQACCESKVAETVTGKPKAVGADSNAVSLAKAVVDQHSGRFNGFMNVFADGFQDTKLEMHRYILAAVVSMSSDGLLNGLRMRDIKSWINSHHPGGAVNTGNITQALQSMAALQVKKNQKPIVLDYDASALRLFVVDRSFVMWLEYQNKDDLLELIDVDIS